MTANTISPQRIAVVKPCCIGDCVLALPAIDALRRAHPASEIVLFVGSHSSAVFESQPTIDAVVPIPDQPRPADAPRLAWRLRRGRFDLGVQLDRSRALALASRLSGIGRVAGVVRQDPEMRHEAEVYLDVVRSLGVPAAEPVPKLELPDRARAAAFLLVGEAGRFAVLHPGGAENPGARMLSKRWPADWFVELARNLRQRGIDVFLSGGPSERALALDIARRANLPESRALAGVADLLTTAAVIEGAALYVGPDTGVSHLAAAVGTPTVAIFGPTNPARYRPLGRQVAVLATQASWELPDVDLRKPQRAAADASTALVSLDEVIAACDRLLAAATERRR